MFKRLEVIALIPSHNQADSYTLYLFQKESRMILPVGLTSDDIRRTFRRKNNDSQVNPEIYDTFKRVLLALGAKVICISIYNYAGGKFYTYLNLLVEKRHLEIHVGLADALGIAKTSNSPIFIRHRILEQQGIKVTAKLIKDALGE